jgi:hypothetical protein
VPHRTLGESSTCPGRWGWARTRPVPGGDEKCHPGLGLDVAPLRPALEPLRAGSRDPRAVGDPGRAISFDLRLAWPVAGGDAWSGPALRPYVTLGPALFVMEPADPMAWLGDRGDVALSLGVKAGAGISWHLDPGAVLFGEYRLTRGSEERTLPLGRGGAGPDVSGFDVLYGVRIRF